MCRPPVQQTFSSRDRWSDSRRRHRAAGELRAYHGRDLGAQRLVERISLSCGSDPTLSCTRKRSCSKISCWNRIYSITCCGDPTKFAPRSVASASYCSTVIGCHPRSRRIVFIVAANVRIPCPVALLRMGSAQLTEPRERSGLAAIDLHRVGLRRRRLDSAPTSSRVLVMSRRGRSRSLGGRVPRPDRRARAPR